MVWRENPTTPLKGTPMTCTECEKYEGKPWFDSLWQVAVLVPYASYSEIEKTLYAIARYLGHPDNISGLEHLLLHLMTHLKEKERDNNI